MRIYREITTADEIRENAWSGAVSTLDLLEDEEILTILGILEEANPEGMDETAFNDYWWHEGDDIANIIGYDSLEALYADRAY